MPILSYIFWPNPGNATYQSPKAMALMIICGLMVLAAIGISQWRKRMKNPVTKRLSRSWPTASFWFGLVGVILVVSRVEQISYVSMRLWWIIWAASLLFYLWLQFKVWRMRHYQQLPGVRMEDPRDKYLPRKKR